MKKNLPLIFLILITALGLFIRLYKFGQAPAGLYLDEAAQGFNAYSILKTGKDEFGKPFPMAFRSFGDFKTPVYIYLIVPLIPLFGLNTVSIRLPSLIFSVLTLPLLYFLIIELAGKNKRTICIALVSALLLAISPWHTLFGRTNFECNVALFLLLLGVFLFQKGLKKPVLLIISAITFALAFPAYHSERVLVPLILVYLFIKYFKTLFSKSHFAYSITSIVIGFILVFPTIKIMATPGFMARVSALNISSVLHLSESLYSPVYRLVREFFSLYLSYFSPRSLFFLGDSGPRSSFPELSVFYTWQLPLYLYGLYLLIKDKTLKNLKPFLILMLLISPIPAALTRDPFSTIRSLPLVIPLCLVIALSIEKILSCVNSLTQKCAAITFFIIIFIYSLGKLFSSGIVLNEFYRASYWDYGWEEVAMVIKTLDPNIPVVVDNVRAEPYSQLAVFLQVDPAQYQQDNFEVTPDNYYTDMVRNTTKRLGNVTTRPIDWKTDTHINQYLIGDELSISTDQLKTNHLSLIKEILYPNKHVAYRIVKTNPLEK